MAALAAMILVAGVYAEEIQPGSYMGRLSDESSIDGTGRAYTDYRLLLSAEETVFISLTSDDFDTYLVLTPPEGHSLENDDFRGMGTDSGLFYQSEYEGIVDLRVTSFSREEYGDYLLKITTIETSPLTESSIQGRLEADYEGLPFSAFSYTAADYAELSVDLQSRDFDTYLYAMLPDGSLLENDDADWDTTDSRLILSVSPEDRLLIIAGSFFGDEQGDFEIHVQEYEPAVVSEEWEDFHYSADAMVWTGILNSRAPIDSSGNFYNEHSIQLEAGETIRITAESDDFDTVLYLLDPSGRTVAENDDYYGSNSMVEYRAERGGLFNTRVRSFSSSGSGRYTIRAEFVR